MGMEDNKAIVRSFLEALDRQNVDALKEHPGLYTTVSAPATDSRRFS